MSGPITYLATHFPAVSHTFIADEVEALRAAGTEVVTISINPPAPGEHQAEALQHHPTTYLKALPRRKVLAAVAATVLRHPSVLSIPWRGGTGGTQRALWRNFQLAEAIIVYRVMRRAGSQHLHAHFGQAPATIAWYAIQVARKHRSGRQYTWSVTIHGWHEFAAEHESMLRQKIAAARFVACVSDYTRAQLCRIADVDDWAKIRVVRCGVNFARFTLRHVEPTDTPPRVAIVARVSPEKGHLALVDAVAALRERGVEVAVDAIGPDVDAHGDAVRQHANTLGVGDAITWHGPLPSAQVATHLARASVFCLPSSAEGLPVVIMEAMATGVPVVTTYVAGIPELAVDHKTALVVPAGRSDLLADALAEVLADQAMRHALVDAARLVVQRDHDITQNVRVLARLFDEAVRGTRS